MRPRGILQLAFQSVRSNLLRGILTLMIIAFGILALVGILTAIDSIIFSMSDNFSSLGSNAFSIERKYERGGRHGGRQAKISPRLPLIRHLISKKNISFLQW